MSDEYRPIPGYEGLYSITREGRVWSYRTNKELKPQLHNGGYMIIFLTRPDEKGCWLGIGPLVLTTFIGPQPLDQECRHLNGIPTDNNLDNLKWGTHTDNMKDKILLGRAASRFTETDIIEIRRLHSLGISQYEIAARFDTYQGFISKVVNKKVWSHVD